MGASVGPPLARGGIGEGAWVGPCVGSFVGSCVGPLEGSLVGDFDGEIVVGLGVHGSAGGFGVGSRVGSAEGSRVGLPEGAVVGSRVGAAEGADVGSLVGSFDGRGVGGDAVGAHVGSAGQGVEMRERASDASRLGKSTSVRISFEVRRWGSVALQGTHAAGQRKHTVPQSESHGLSFM